MADVRPQREDCKPSHTGTLVSSLNDLVSDLTYINYAHNRQISPHISVERWEKVYGPTAPAMEARYQAELGGTR